MLMRRITCFILLSTGLVCCETKLKNSWQAKPFINAFEEEQGVMLYIAGERLSDNVEEALVSFNMNQDLISGGFKEVFTFTLNGSSSWGEDYLKVITPGRDTVSFNIYDGLLFNIDYESTDVSQFIELMNHESLEIHSGKYQFTISTSGFLDLYKENFLQPTS
jgi:hypothetical protein